MAITTIDTNNKLIRFTQEINREFVRQNMFSPYMGEDVNSIIRVRNELKAGGEQMNIPIVSRLTGAGVATGTLVGNEERIDNYGMRVWLEWARHAVVSNKAENQKDSADIFGEAKPLLSDWGKELQRDEIIAALMALPSETQPAAGVRVNGIQYDLASAAQRNTWRSDNLDRVLYGAAVSNSATDHATSLATLDGTADKLTAATLSLAKRVAQNAIPKIRPYKTADGYEYYVAFAGTNAFRDLKLDLAVVNKDARPREDRGGTGGAPRNPIFQDGDQIYDGVIVRCVPEISSFIGTTQNPGPWGTVLLTAGQVGTPAGYTGRVEPVFVCGQQAATVAWGQMAKPTFRQENDYQFITGTGIEMAYGVGKMFKKHPNTGTALKQWGMVTLFVAAPQD
jgi:Protein of unknown function (DUF4043)